jgi:hypothetical protein
MTVRPEVVNLWLDLYDEDDSWLDPDRWRHQDGTPFTAAERGLLGSMTPAEAQAGAAVSQARADQANAALYEAEWEELAALEDWDEDGPDLPPAV